MCIQLRESSEIHCDLLYKWRNEKITRENSFDIKLILYPEHKNWYKKILKDNNVRQFIVYKKDIPVGQIRINIENSKGQISFSIDSNFRGNGYGWRILVLIKEVAKNDIKVIDELYGKVKYDNIPSQRVFEKAGFKRTNKNDCVHFNYKVKG